MRTKILLTSILSILALSVSAQKPMITLTFTAENNGLYVPLDSIRIENLTQGGDTTLYPPDTVLLLNFLTGYDEHISTGDKGLAISQNYPNPIQGKTTINIYVPGYENVRIRISDILGRELINRNYSLEPGIHTFTFIPGSENFYFLTTATDQEKQSLKMFNSPFHSSSYAVCKLEYSGIQNGKSGFKSGKELNGFVFSPGDSLQFIANSCLIERTIIDTPTTDTTYIFNFLPVPCPASVSYEGQIYNTVIIGNKCWLKKNLNAGTMIDGNVEMADNGIIEKYCYDNLEDNCTAYGGLYQWDEAMEYTTSQGAKGICPPGWHIPTDEEWKELEGEADSQFGYPDPEWNQSGWRGFDAGLNLKSPTGWNGGGNGTNLTNFGAKPAGNRQSSGSFEELHLTTDWWLSGESSPDDATIRCLFYSEDGSKRSTSYSKVIGFSVRCLQDNNIPVADFSASPTIGPVPLTVTFSDLSTNNPTSWQWNFGDGGTSTLQNPTHTYNEPDSYVVQLTASNICGSDIQIKINYINVTSFEPCPGSPTVEYEGQVYNTVLIGSQCWLKENLNVGTMINGSSNQTDNGLKEKYCYENIATNCETYGGLYQWNEMMGWFTQGVQGICPPGWHIPTDEEWKELEGTVDSQYGYPDPEWDEEGIRGYNVGWNLKSTTGWSYSGNGADIFGFMALPGGYRYTWNYYTFFSGLGEIGTCWTSNYQSVIDGWGRNLWGNNNGSERGDLPIYDGRSVRCLQDTTGSAPDANFEGTPVSGTTPLTVYFTDLSSNNPTGWDWNFGDFSTSSEQNPTHTYNTAGSYTVRLTATNIYGSDTEIKTNYITVSEGGPGEPCPGTPTVTYEGQVYHTVLIGSQCWLQENLNVGTMINGSNNQTNNGQNEKYCYDNNATNCAIFGGLYQWDEIMGYTTIQGVQGICPPEWHIPTDEEWKELEGTADSQYGYPDPEWNGDGFRGFDAGLNLKSTTGWYDNGNGTDLYGFSALPGGFRYPYGAFFLFGYAGSWWSSSGSGGGAWTRGLSGDNDKSLRNNTPTSEGSSVRCLKDSFINPVANFIGTPLGGLAPLDVNFTDLSINNPTSWQWNFGDGGTSALQNPLHTYNATGSYTVQLTVTNSYGYDTEIKTNYITVTDTGSAPIANFSGNPTFGSAPLTVVFTDLSINTPTNWQWNFGDGGTSTLQNPTHTYNSAGNYTVNLTATNFYGSSTEIKTDYIIVSEGGNGEPCPGMFTVTDIDGNVYNTALIGNKCWMAENLKTTTYHDGTAIPNVTNANAWSVLTSGAYIWYENDITWKAKYGALYNWFATIDTSGLCPEGWHVPDHAEWTSLTDYIGGTGLPQGYELKSCRQVNSPLGGVCNTSEHPRWNSNSSYWGIDDYSFSGLPGGIRWTSGPFTGIGGNGLWWSSSQYSSSSAWARGMSSNSGDVYVGYDEKRGGHSVRCIRD